MAAQVVKKLPEGDDWTYELKFDGYRALIIKDKELRASGVRGVARHSRSDRRGRARPGVSKA